MKSKSDFVFILDMNTRNKGMLSKKTVGQVFFCLLCIYEIRIFIEAAMKYAKAISSFLNYSVMLYQ